MTDLQQAREIALSLPDVEEYEHFGRPAFKRRGGRTFATLWPAQNRMMIKLSLVDQSVFHSFGSSVFHPVPNKWGQKGATFVELSNVRADMLYDAISTAWENASLKK